MRVGESTTATEDLSTTGTLRVAIKGRFNLCWMDETVQDSRCGAVVGAQCQLSRTLGSWMNGTATLQGVGFCKFLGVAVLSCSRLGMGLAAGLL